VVFFAIWVFSMAHLVSSSQNLTIVLTDKCARFYGVFNSKADLCAQNELVTIPSDQIIPVYVDLSNADLHAHYQESLAVYPTSFGGATQPYSVHISWIEGWVQNASTANPIATTAWSCGDSCLHYSNSATGVKVCTPKSKYWTLALSFYQDKPLPNQYLTIRLSIYTGINAPVDKAKGCPSWSRDHWYAYVIPAVCLVVIPIVIFVVLRRRQKRVYQAI